MVWTHWIVGGGYMEIKRYCYKNKKNPKYNREFLWVDGAIHFDDETIFCGKPWIGLLALKDLHDPWWNDYEIAVAIHDNDDYDVGVIYTAKNEEQFFDVLHELINWVKDLEHGLCYYNEFITDTKGFFPDLGCEKRY